MELIKEKAKENLAKLIDKFDRESFAGRIKEYNEEVTQTAFIQPLLKDVLGWDVSDRNEVSPEEKISRGRVDYGLKVDGKIKFYVEAKPPKADLGKHIEQAAIRTINFSEHSEKKLHDDLVSLVDAMMNLNKKMQTAKGNQKEQIQRQIEKTDREIDEIVYKLYGLTEEEIKIVEGK